eukprot:CAMPEP_0179157638 /NCGR_PEP_ID=MMETSP0796-20121207/76891_1 /TAXON_ID=73915 /ORGANISM="Pyrodinium bahamense, Strain pbaha01" /LENGTH=33 /DNA_ID= /DNA_START= /DNA_END= /DNA_ORIENTATION=
MIGPAGFRMLNAALKHAQLFSTPRMKKGVVDKE